MAIPSGYKIFEVTPEHVRRMLGQTVRNNIGTTTCYIALPATVAVGNALPVPAQGDTASGISLHAGVTFDSTAA